MSEGAGEEDKTHPAFATTSALDGMSSAIGEPNMIQREEIRDGYGDIGALLTCGGSLVKAYAIGDPTVSPVRKMPVELLAEIFVQCVQWVYPTRFSEDSEPDSEPDDRINTIQQVRARLGQVCCLWNTILNGEPRVWMTLILNKTLPPPGIVSLWVTRSKSHPLDIFTCLNFPCEDRGIMDIFALLRRELWRIRRLHASTIHYLPLMFPPGVSVAAPMMQSLTLSWKYYANIGEIHCPELRSLTLDTEGDEKSIIVKPMEKMHHLDYRCTETSIMSNLKLLDALPNLVSLTWSTRFPGSGVVSQTLPRVVLQSLKSFSFTLEDGKYRDAICAIDFLACLNIPSLEHLELRWYTFGGLIDALDAVCGHGTVQLRRLTLRSYITGTNTHAMLKNLNHPETLRLEYGACSDYGELVDALSPRNRGFSSACPQLKTVELEKIVHGAMLYISPHALFKFVQRRVASVDEPAPGLVTCLKLD